jgi:tetratricopeptide (TPR) repeat protein
VPIDRQATLRNAENLLRQGKLDQAAAEYVRVVEDQPGDWNTANVLGDLYVRAGQVGKAVEQFIRIGDHLHDQGFLPKAAAVYKKVLKLEPDQEHAKLRVADIAGSQGLAADARALLNPLLDRRRARGDVRGVAEIVVKLAALDPNDFAARMAGVRARLELDDQPGALRDLKNLAAYLQEKERTDEALQALEEAARLDPDDAEVRAMLAERGGPVEEAQTELGIAEDLVAREPWEPANVERYRRALVLLGEPDPDAIIADRLSGIRPFTSTGRDEQALVEAAESLEAAEAVAPADVAPVEDVAVAVNMSVSATATEEHARADTVPVRLEGDEVDLSIALDGIKQPAESNHDGITPKAVEPISVLPSGDVDEEYRKGVSLFEAGRADDAIEPLRAAVRAPRLRFASASLLGRIFRSRGELDQAIEWFERAALAPAPSPDQGHLLLFDLADALEHGGETSRALAVCIELQADAGNYRDVADRIDRLAKVRSRG